MSSYLRKASRSKSHLPAVKAEFKKPVTPFEEIDLSTVGWKPPGMTRVFRNSRYTVMIYDNSLSTVGPVIRILIQRHDDQPFTNHWGEIQKIKNEIFGPEVVAVEYYPAESKLINDHNIYWIWIYPEGMLPIPL